MAAANRSAGQRSALRELDGIIGASPIELPFGWRQLTLVPVGGLVLMMIGGSSLDAEEEFILQKLMEGYKRPPPRRTSGRGDRSRYQPRPLASPTRAVRELLDEFEEIFFHEGATLNYVDSVAKPWRQAGLRPPEVRDWLDAGVYSDEPDLAVALATAGFEPRQAARIKARYGVDSESMSVISWVRGSSNQGAMARMLMDRLVAVRERAQREAGQAMSARGTTSRGAGA